MKKHLLYLFAITILPTVPAFSQNADFFSTQDKRLEWFKDARFGMFIHWGPVSLTGREIGWSRGGERRGRQGTGETPVEIYDNLYKHFNPSLYDAEEWVRIAKKAGMKYMVFTTKHHDGFCNWDTQYTDYNITSEEALYGQDIAKALSDACHKLDMPIGWYYSLPDWYDADYLTDNHDQFLQMMHGQVRELLTNYGKIDIVWFDLGSLVHDDGTRTCDPAVWDAENLINMVHELQPQAIVNNRSCLDADFGTPEQRIGGYQENPAWESCITIGRQWAWKPKDDMKSIEQCLHTLVRTAGGNGNLLFNVGPMPDGRIEPRQVDLLKEMGAWLNQYGASIYGTRGGPFLPTDWGVSTRQGNIIYLHLLQWHGQKPKLILPDPGIKIIKCTLMTGQPLTYTYKKKNLVLEVPSESLNEINTVIVLEMEQDVMGLKAMPVPSQSLSFEKPSTASSVEDAHWWAPANATNGDWVGVGWKPSPEDKTPWIEVDLGKEERISSIILFEDGNKIQSFELETKTKTGYHVLHKGEAIGRQLKIPLDNKKARTIKLKITSASGVPSIKEIVVLR